MQVAKYVYVKKFDIRILILILDEKNNRNKQTNKLRDIINPIRGSCVTNQNWYGEIKKREAGSR